MRRDIAAAPSWQEPAKREAIEVELQLITPMFGGGYVAREVDPLMPIRPAAIRGHLRFWWRATAGAQYSSAEELYKAETAIWGGTTKDGEPVYGKVVIQVEIEIRGELKKCAEYEWDHSRGRYKAVPRFLHDWPAYALHPFQGKAARDKIVEDPATGLCNARFRVLLIYDSTVPAYELNNALSAWVLYGGVGARTRRGCGSLAALSGFHPNIDLLHSKQLAELTVLKGSKFVLGSSKQNPVEAWREAVELYQHFRQGRGFARQQTSRRNANRPGRSFWPEPDSIRRLAKTWHPLHRPIHQIELGFPRADLGLPIVFHFLDEGNGDPVDTVLQRSSKIASRMASPIITKAVQTGNNQYRPLILVLNAPHAWTNSEIMLSYVGGSKVLEKVGQAEIDLTQSQRKLISPLNQYGGLSIRDALLEHAGKRWKSKVEVI